MLRECGRVETRANSPIEKKHNGELTDNVNILANVRVIAYREKNGPTRMHAGIIHPSSELQYRPSRRVCALYSLRTRPQNSNQHGLHADPIRLSSGLLETNVTVRVEG